ncbi:zinc finger protein 292-like [Solea senegalensis]|uniref:Zinc finger protein 292-like n=2 Tax=Solea senegalensis TaxID=28829 RepID=A0AAV6RZD6_SOLSE|nr:zinc finger protein 292a [Solea senegalensis]KAG7510577.1 zinc finger protein 292-like [Solea senegalensis]
MAEGETEKEYDTPKAIVELRERFQALTAALKGSSQSALEASLHFCQEFCQVLVEHAGRWKTDEDPLPLLEVYTVAILSFAKAASCLSSECENVPLLLEKLALSCAELLLLLPHNVPGALWEEFQSSMKLAHSLLQESGSTQLCLLAVLAQQDGVWSNTTLSCILSNQIPQIEQIHEYLELEGPALLNMRVKHLIKVDSVEKAAVLAKMCSEYPGYEGKGNFKQTYLLCICMAKKQEQLMEEIASIDCKDALEMICNLESEGDEKGALCLCSAFLKRQLLQGDVYCAWELTLFWSKLLMRLESSAETFLGHSKEMALLCRSVCHILFLIKVIQNEVGEVGLPVCVEMCIQALKMTSSDHKDSKSTICKTISCLLPTDLEVKRACQLTEFLLQPTVDSYYAVESLYNEPDQKPEEDGSLRVPNSLRCELLLALKTQWPFDPEFWDWKTLKRNCLALMGDEASIVSSIDTLNDTDEQEVESAVSKLPEYGELEDFLLTTTNELNEISDEKEKNREAKKLREQGFVSARFRNWRAYMQYCVLCDKEFLGHRIVRHAQKHFKDGMYLCPICADSFESREVLEPHVASHVKQSCKERLAAMKAARKAPKPPQSPKSPAKNSKVAVKTHISAVKVEPQAGDQLASPVKIEQTTSDPQISQDCFCPVKNCSKAFKFFRNLMAHVRSHKDDDEAMRFLEIQKQKVVCQYCRRQFVNVRHLNDHLQMHCGTKPYICIQLDCKANFNSNSELLMHRKTHPEFKAQCMFPNCGQVFSEAYLLYDHEAQHYLTYTCQVENCGKIFYSQSHFLSHQGNHSTNNAVNNLPTVNQNPPVTPNAAPPPESTPSKDDTCSAVACHEKISTEAKEASNANSSPCRSPEVSNEPGPVRVKHSVESMLNQALGTEMTEPEKCYTPLTNPCAEPADGKPPGDAPQVQQTVAGPDEIPSENPAPSSANPVTHQPGAGNNTVHAHEDPKEILQIMSPSQIKTEIPCSVHAPAVAVAAVSDVDLHCCPYKDCTRAYSTNKSLSRHVKKQHPEIFEDWKLAKKYNKVAKITAKKKPGGPTSPSQSPNMGNRSANRPGVLCNKPRMQQQMDYPVGCSSSPAQCYPGSMEPVPITPMVNPTLYPAWGNQQSPSGMMQSDMTQPWSSPPMNNCYPDTFNMNDYSSRSYTQWQVDPYQTTAPIPHDRDHSMAATIGPNMSQAPSDSSLMSQYVSSSLMLDNGGQMHNGGHQYGLLHPDTSGDIDVRKHSASVSGQLDNRDDISTVDSLTEGSFHTTYAHSENSCLTQGSPVNIPMKCLSPEVQGDLKITPRVIKTESMSSPCYDQMDNSVDGMLSPQSVTQTDFPCDEDCPDAESEAHTPDDKGGDSDAPKGKRNKLSKRAKWPAIIKDGKVICRRCFREFTSTKSLGGHLSKRSQCKPLDEIDLTADLPTSFLDFLNDPHVPDTNGAVYNMPNGDFSQESSSFTSLTSPVVLKQEPHSTNIMDYSNSFTAPPENQQEKAVELANPGLGVTHQEDHLMEISHAFQRMDLIEAAQEKMRNALSLEQNVSHRDTVTKSKVQSKSDDRLPEKVAKPFKCEQEECECSFMTKEALFKHLTKMHDFTHEMIEELKRTPCKLSPYPCQVCPKTFTRTTGLKIHYEKVHRLSKAEIQKLKISARNRRAFKLNKDDAFNGPTPTDANTSRTSQPVPIMLAIKQEPLDIAIAPQTENKSNPEVHRITTPGDAVKEGFTPESSTVTRLPSPQHYFSDGSFGEATPVPEGTPEQPRAAVVNRSPDVRHKSNLKEKLSPIGKAKEQRGKSDAASSNSSASASSSPEKPGSSKNTPSKDESQRKEKFQKRLSLKMCDTDNAFSPYRPYRCVHEGCTAAFTIQQNLILHYRAMHQAALSTTKVEAEADDDDADDAERTSVNNDQENIVKDNEVRCQVKNCSRVFMGVTKLVQHYLLLHKFTRDKATTMMASMNLGTFNCDRSECSLPFTSVERYIEHIKNYHKDIAISESGSVDPTYKCEYGDCERIYTTKSNLLRHLLKKHDYVYDPRASDGRRTKSAGLFQGVNGKENVENKLKLKKKNSKKKEAKSIEHWTSFGKPTLKTHEEASAMCTKKSALQYPCMIIGCDAVERAERHIFKHYVTHGLTERYIEDQRSQFIFCKKYSRSRFKESNKSEGASSSSEETDPEDAEMAGDQKTDELDRMSQEDSKLSNDDSAESQASTGTEGATKRGRPRKPAHPTPACPERMQTLRNRLTGNSSRENSNPGTPTAQEQHDDVIMSGSFKPLGLEDSFLKFLETSESTQSSKRKLNDKSSSELPSKRHQTVKQRSATRSRAADEFRGCGNLVDFRNPLNLKSVSNVKIVMDKTFSDGAELLLKQLQDMKPIVKIKKWLYSGS